MLVRRFYRLVRTPQEPRVALSPALSLHTTLIRLVDFVDLVGTDEQQEYSASTSGIDGSGGVASIVGDLFITTQVDEEDGVASAYAYTPVGVIERRAVYLGSHLGCVLLPTPSITKDRPEWFTNFVVPWLRRVGVRGAYLHPDVDDAHAAIIKQQLSDWRVLRHQLSAFHDDGSSSSSNNDANEELDEQQRHREQQQQQKEQAQHRYEFDALNRGTKLHDAMLHTDDALSGSGSGSGGVAEWPTGDTINGTLADAALRRIKSVQRLEQLVARDFERDNLRAVVALYRGQIVAERYSTADGISSSTRLHGGRMSSIVLNALLAIRVRQGAVDSSLATEGVAIEWLNDSRRKVTVRDLFRYLSIA